MKVFVILTIVCLLVLQSAVDARDRHGRSRHHSQELKKSVNFKDCGSQGGTIKQVIITPCDKEPCVFKRGENVGVEVDFTASVKSANATFKAFATIFGQQIPLGLPQPNACELPNTKCPLAPGTDYEPEEQIQVPSDVPPIFIPIDIQVQLIGDNNLELLCGQISVKVQ